MIVTKDELRRPRGPKSQPSELEDPREASLKLRTTQVQNETSLRWQMLSHCGFLGMFRFEVIDNNLF